MLARLELIVEKVSQEFWINSGLFHLIIRCLSFYNVSHEVHWNIVGCTSTIVIYCSVFLQPVNANVLLNDTSELEARVEVLEVQMINVQSDVANTEDDVNNVEIQVNNVESQLINVQEDITDNEDQIFGNCRVIHSVLQHK